MTIIYVTGDNCHCYGVTFYEIKDGLECRN